MSAIQDMLVQIAPELADLPQGQINQAILTAQAMHSTEVFGANYTRVCALWCAFTLTKWAQSSDGAGGGAVGPLTMRKEGDLALGYGNRAISLASSSQYDSNPYGVSYLQLIRSLKGFTAFLSGSSPWG